MTGAVTIDASSTLQLYADSTWNTGASLTLQANAGLVTDSTHATTFKAGVTVSSAGAFDLLC